MTLRHLRIFISVYETLSFTKAGQRLHLAQPSVSLAIRELEDFYAVPLFDRIKHAIYPTEYGEKLYNYATHILTLFDEMEKSIKDWDTQSTIKIGSSITIGNQILPDLLHLFKAIYPQISMEVIVNNSNTIEHYILQNKIEFALIENDPSLDKIASIPFMSDYLCTVAHPENPLTTEKKISLERIAKENFLMREHGSSVRELVESIFLTNQISVKAAWESTSTQALIKAVESNLGITTLPYQLVKEKIREQKLAVLDVPLLKLDRHYNIIYYKDKFLSKAVVDFFDLCKKYGNEFL